ncbi:hypothetical protein AA14337_0009 [Acetobacter malorum DSM 14337]|uniref:IcmE protein n=1 Tax=Acetobacter malorum DSM 14337 TaxID=1307910 RepID=A0ABQ0PLJ9_9PROT|nr:DotG/IcmE/VirB10 family protein [Acetobacter malorum]KXV08702.1 hypothetical protein AD930_03565 [Acetobacter malorum]GBQ74776.1 hypothetical protein AA14337_0009 [Acetobacter malorum DSM 14337]
MKNLMKKKGLLASVSGIALVGVIATYMIFGSSPPTSDSGTGGRADISNVPALHTDNMNAVGRDEANRRVTRNTADAEQARAEGKGYVAPPTIAEAVPNRKDDAAGPKRQARVELPPVEGIHSTDQQAQGVNSAPVYAASPDMASEMQMMGQQLGDQVDEVVSSTLGGANYMTVASYDKPKPVGAAGASRAVNGAASGVAGVAGGNGAIGPDGKPSVDLSQYDMVLAAKPGDVFYASFKIGFNSDDPQGLPIFATIHDARQDGTYGPLDGAVLMGSVNYTQRQAAVTFTQLILPDGRQADTKAMAVKMGSLRAGVASKVNYHSFGKYASLTFASLLEGLGYAGEMFVQNSRSYTANNSGVYSMGNNGVIWPEAGLMAAMPLGQNLNSALGQNFNRQPTKIANANDEIGIVFLQSVQIPEGMKGGRQAPGQEAPSRSPFPPSGPMGGSVQQPVLASDRQ